MYVFSIYKNERIIMPAAVLPDQLQQQIAVSEWLHRKSARQSWLDRIGPLLVPSRLAHWQRQGRISRTAERKRDRMIRERVRIHVCDQVHFTLISVASIPGLISTHTYKLYCICAHACAYDIDFIRICIVYT